MKNLLLIIILLLMLISCGDSTKPKDNPTTPFSEMYIENIRPTHTTPYKIRYLFSLRDENDHAIVINNEDLSKLQYTILEDDVEIDYSESNVIVKNTSNFNIDVVLVLDFSLSMQSAGGIPTMIEGAKAVINSLKDTHRIAIIEFHHNEDGNNYSLIQPFTVDKQEAISNLDNFVEEGIYHGFSLCWDAIKLALDQYDTEPEYDTVRSIVFISDGFDNNSSVTTEELITEATEKNVRIYSISYGNTNEAFLTEMQLMAENTNGESYQNLNLTNLNQQFNEIIKDLGGNYQISYTTPNLNDFSVSIGLNYENIIAPEPITENITISQIAGSITTGILSFENFTLENYTLEFDLSAQHLPAGIDSLRFKLQTFHATEIFIPDVSEGGVLKNWSVPEQNFDLYWETGGEPTALGDFGYLIHFRILNVNESNLNIPITFDNSIYPNGIYLYDGNSTSLDGNNSFVYHIIIGTGVKNPHPLNFATDVDTLTSFSWETEINRREDTIYRVIVDTTNFFLEPVIDTTLTVTNFTPNSSLLPEKEYFWRVLINPDENTDIEESLLWQFTTVKRDSTTTNIKGL